MGRGANGETLREPVAPGRGLFHNRDFLIPYFAETQSIAGDQIGRVALSILVFDRTGSVAWTALTYALTYLPAILGGFVLGGVGDRLPRVWVMVGTDLLRAVLFLGVAIRGVPLPVVVVLVAASFFLGPAFTAAMVSRLSAVLVPSRFRAASGVRMVTAQAAQVAGFAVGGVIVGIVGPHAALLINAATFALSALVVGVALGRGPAARPAAPSSLSLAPLPSSSSVGTGESLLMPTLPLPRLLGDPWLRHLMLMTALAAFFVVPEGLAVPLTHQFGASPSVAGLLLAAGPLGSAVGAAALVRFVPHRHGMRTARLMAIVCGVPLTVTALSPAWPVVLACWAVSGALWAYQVDVATAFVHAVDDRVRARTIARASAVLLGAQGVGLAVFGAVGGLLGAQWGVALAGLAGIIAAVLISLDAHARGLSPVEVVIHHPCEPPESS